jgi:cation transport ATPase
MSIPVTCPGCLKRFQVNDKFAGKSGPCPNCKKIIKVPAKTEEIVVHAPEEFEHGGRGASGKLVLKPIDREESKITPLLIAIIIAAILLIFVGDWIFGKILFNKVVLFGFLDVFVTVGLLIVSPLTAFAGYSFLRNEELEPYRGTTLYVRTLICGAAYVILWGVFMYAFHKFAPADILNWGVLVVPFLVAGTAAAWVTLDLEPGNAFCHYAFYLFVTVLLRWIAGMGWIWQK